jgi:hypothetical protein
MVSLLNDTDCDQVAIAVAVLRYIVSQIKSTVGVSCCYKRQAIER